MEIERQRNATLASKLKKAKAKNRKLVSSAKSTPVPSRFQSTMRANHLEGTEYSGNGSLSASMSGLSFASLNITECKPTEGEDEIDRKSFENWRDLLEASMKLVGAVDEETKMSIFRIKAGSKLLEILEGTISSPSTPSAEIAPYSNAMKRLVDHFGSRDYCLLQRQKLRSLTQGVNESDLKYVKRVVSSARLCNFSDDQFLENVAEVIQYHALSLKVREMGRKILRKGGTIPELLEKVRAFEMDRFNEEVFAKTHRPLQAEVSVISTSKPPVSDRAHVHNPRFGVDRSRPTYQSAKALSNQERSSKNQPLSGNRYPYRGDGALDTKQKQCFRCLSRLHPHYECPVAGRVCRNCLCKGHIARACTEPRGPSKRKPTVDSEAQDGPAPKKIALLSEDELAEEKSVSSHP